MSAPASAGCAKKAMVPPWRASSTSPTAPARTLPVTRPILPTRSSAPDTSVLGRAGSDQVGPIRLGARLGEHAAGGWQDGRHLTQDLADDPGDAGGAVEYGQVLDLAQRLGSGPHDLGETLRHLLGDDGLLALGQRLGARLDGGGLSLAAGCGDVGLGLTRGPGGFGLGGADELRLFRFG